MDQLSGSFHAYFFSNAFPRGGAGFDFVRLEDLFDHGQMFRQARAAGGGGRRGAVGSGRGLLGVSAGAAARGGRFFSRRFLRELEE